MSSVACRFWSTDWSERIFRTAPVLHILQGTSNVRRPIQYSYEYEYGLPPALQYRTLREYGDALSLAVESSIVRSERARPPQNPPVGREALLGLPPRCARCRRCASRLDRGRGGLGAAYSLVRAAVAPQTGGKPVFTA